MLRVKWCGFDFGQCLMDPSGLRNPLMFGDICKWVGKPHAIADKVRKYRVLKEKYGDYGRIKEGHRDEILTYVLDGDAEAMEIFSQKEQELLRVGAGLSEALEFLQSQGIAINVVSELKKTLGPVGTDIVSRFLQTKGLVRYFRYLITPQGKIDLVSGEIDLSYRGLTKEQGTIYDKLAHDLAAQGIGPEEAVIIGDKPTTDIYPAKQRGFKTIQYTGCMDYGTTGADFVISHFLELKDILRGPNEAWARQ